MDVGEGRQYWRFLLLCSLRSAHLSGWWALCPLGFGSRELWAGISEVRAPAKNRKCLVPEEFYLCVSWVHQAGHLEQKSWSYLWSQAWSCSCGTALQRFMRAATRSFFFFNYIWELRALLSGVQAHLPTGFQLSVQAENWKVLSLTAPRSLCPTGTDGTKQFPLGLKMWTASICLLWVLQSVYNSEGPDLSLMGFACQDLWYQLSSVTGTARNWKCPVPVGFCLCVLSPPGRSRGAEKLVLSLLSGV